MKKRIEIARSHKKINRPEKAQEYINKLNNGEKEYKFDTHEGFKFTKGNLKEPLSEFYTVERFLGRRIKLNFLILVSNEKEIKFSLTNKLRSLNIQGKLTLKGKKISLQIFSKPQSRLKKIFARTIIPIMRPLINQQIKKEARFIKKEIESL